MPEYLAPGVFVEEVSFRNKSIEGVGTSVAAIVGPTRSGPLRGVPEVVTSYAAFERIYGDALDLSFGTGTVLNHTAHAARAFFDNGGKQLFVSRVVAGVNAATADGTGASALHAARADGGNIVRLRARAPGRQGNYWLELRWRGGENLLRSESITVGAARAGTTYLLQATGVPAAAKATGPLANGSFPLTVSAVVRLNGANLEVQAERAQFTSTTDPANPAAVASDQVTAFVAAQLPANARLTRVFARQPASGALVDGTSAEITLSRELDLSAYTRGAHWGALRVLRGTLDAAGETFSVSANAQLNPGVAAPLTLPMAALASSPGAVGTVVVLRGFDIDVRSGGRDGEVIATYANMSTAPAGDTSMPVVMAASPARRQDALASPVQCTFDAAATGPAVLAALLSMCEAAALSPGAASIDEPRYLIELRNGTDGNPPEASDYAGIANETLGSTGFAALEDVEDVSIVMAPAAAAHAATHVAVVQEMLKHCRRMRYRVGIVDAREGMSVAEVREMRNEFDDSRLALYHPWVVAAGPTGARREITLPPAGFIAGIYARTDVDRGVHKAPANEVVLGALGFQQEINAFQQELLNPNGINCLRSFAGRGHRVWGGRTLSSDPEWKYVNVRRFFLYLERSIEKSTQWAVFEPNGQALWANIRSTVEDFLFNEWRNGRLLGATPKEGYFVRCDRSTMTQNDLDNGRLVCLVGVAPLRPAEFVIFRIGQKTADA